MFARGGHSHGGPSKGVCSATVGEPREHRFRYFRRKIVVRHGTRMLDPTTPHDWHI